MGFAGGVDRNSLIDGFIPTFDHTVVEELVVAAPAGATVTSPNPFRVRSDDGCARFGLGSLVADQVLSLVLTVELPGGKEGAEARIECRLQDPDEILDGTSAAAAFTYAGAEAYDAQPRDDDVDREVASAYATRARRRAAELGRVGAPDEGRAVLEKAAASSCSCFARPVWKRPASRATPP